VIPWISVFATYGQVYPPFRSMGAYTDMGKIAYQGTELKTRMITPQKKKTGKAAGTGHAEAPAIPVAAKKNVQQKKKTVKIATPVLPNPAGMELPVLSKEEQANAHAMHTAAVTRAQEKKNRTKTASHYLHTREEMRSPAISEGEQANAHAMHTVAVSDAQVKKNEAKAVSHKLHNHAGMQAHTVSDKDIAGAIKSGSHNAKIYAHHPHQHTGISAPQDPGHKRSALHKTGKNGFVANLEEETRKNMDFRRVLYTGMNSQLVLMSLKPGEDIGFEIHGDVDQFFRFEEGAGIVEIDGTSHAVADGSGVIVPRGAMHNVTNTSETGFLKLYTIYSPPEHQDKVIRKTKREALASEEHFDGKTTEKYH
jgi:mannose-6-phosphate isomerase-like protein (cupin superfamily)